MLASTVGTVGAHPLGETEVAEDATAFVEIVEKVGRLDVSVDYVVFVNVLKRAEKGFDV